MQWAIVGRRAPKIATAATARPHCTPARKAAKCAAGDAGDFGVLLQKRDAARHRVIFTARNGGLDGAARCCIGHRKNAALRARGCRAELRARVSQVSGVRSAVCPF